MDPNFEVKHKCAGGQVAREGKLNPPGTEARKTLPRKNQIQKVKTTVQSHKLNLENTDSTC